MDSGGANFSATWGRARLMEKIDQWNFAQVNLPALQSEERECNARTHCRKTKTSRCSDPRKKAKTAEGGKVLLIT